MHNVGVMEGCPKEEEERREGLGRAWWKQTAAGGWESIALDWRDGTVPLFVARMVSALGSTLRL